MSNKDVKSYKSYKDWLSSPDESFKPKLIASLNKAGIPLEYKTKRRLENLGFEANPYYYETTEFSPFDSAGIQVGGQTINEIKRRELDLIANFKRGWIIKIKGVDIHLRLKLAVECKYSSDKDFFIFEDQDPLTTFPNFPVKLNGHSILIKDTYKHFDIPMKIKKVTEVDVSKPNTKRKDNFNDRITYTASEQLFSAISHIYSEKQSEIFRIYYEIVNQMDIKKKFENLNREGKIRYVEEGNLRYISEEEKDDFCSKNITHFDFEKIGSYNVDLIFPLIVIDDTRGVIKTILNDKNEIVDFKDVGYGVYTHVSEKVESEYIVGREKLDRELPIVICNLSYLKEFISKLTKGMGILKEDVEDRLNENPHLFVKQLMFNL